MSAKTVLLLCAFAFHLDTVTLQTTPEPYCVYNNVRHEPGPVPSDDPCQSCDCSSYLGEVECFENPCDGCEYGYEPVQPGECCPKCKPPRTPPPSRPEYDYYGPSAERTPPPSRPEYDYYGPSAERTTPSSRQAYYYYEPRYEPIPESPLPSRAACYHEGRPYPEGPVPSNDRCVECECPYGGGDVRCYSGYCPRCPDSAETVTVPGECCPVCRERPTTTSWPEDDYYVPTSEQPTPTPPQPEDDNYVPTTEQPTPTPSQPEDDNYVPTAEP